ncbi:MAG: hypothetical protein U0744_18575 [Gemmataceae bacterium]
MKEDLLLATFGQVGVAIAGFSGIVVALGDHARGNWTSRERQLLTTLLGTSGSSAFLSFLPLLLSSAKVVESTIWVVSSATSLAFQIGLTVRRSMTVIPDVELRNREFALILAMYAGEAAFGLLQAINCFGPAASWPHLATIFWHLGMSFYVFVRLVRPKGTNPPEERPSAQL